MENQEVKIIDTDINVVEKKIVQTLLNELKTKNGIVSEDTDINVVDLKVTKKKGRPVKSKEETKEHVDKQNKLKMNVLNDWAELTTANQKNMLRILLKLN